MGLQTKNTEKEERLSGLIAETPQENAMRLLPGLQYLMNEAQWAGLDEVADVLDGAIDEIVAWVRGSAH